jgi:uncharacterized protein with HEPN domain
MQREVRAYVLDIVEACDAIALDTKDLELDAYRANRQIRSAVEREFITIGEAIATLRQHAPGVFGRITQAQQIVDFRNQLTHAYMTVNDTVVGGIAIRNAPLPRRECADLPVAAGPVGRGLTPPVTRARREVPTNGFMGWLAGLVPHVAGESRA